ncbi:DUF485 domain-containing protein [Actinomadura flavalba]|uniref:DUF485 domain-containing protein n=1 Tax=Actinomadura flavalba TaxID=1120938 RepID=UPI000399ED78
MTTESSGPPPGPAGGGPDQAAYLQIQQSPEFQRLRTAFRRFVFPMTAAFLTWYLLYVVLSAYARGFMGTKVIGEINVALVFGLLQFLSTFLIAWLYERYARRTLEPLAAAVDTDAAGDAPAENGGATRAGATRADDAAPAAGGGVTRAGDAPTATPPADHADDTSPGTGATRAGGTPPGGATRADDDDASGDGREEEGR